MGAGVITQCPHCRALMVVGAVVVDGSRADDGAPRAGLVCGVCNAVAWLPLTTAVSTMPLTTALMAPATPALPSSSSSSLGEAAVEAPSTTVASSSSSSSSPPSSPSSPSSSSSSTSSPSPSPPTAMAAGLDAELVDRIKARQAEATEAQAPLAERFDALLRDRWSSDADHSQLLKAAAVSGELAFVGGRYRNVLDVIAEEPRARAAQQELITLAMATMKTDSGMEGVPGDARINNNTKMLMGLLLFLLIGGGVFMLARWFLASLSTLDAQ